MGRRCRLCATALAWDLILEVGVKFKIKISKRYNMIVSMIACGAALWMLVTRFGYPVEKIIEIFWVCLVFLIVVFLVTAPLALLLRWILSRGDDR